MYREWVDTISHSQTLFRCRALSSVIDKCPHQKGVVQFTAATCSVNWWAMIIDISVEYPSFCFRWGWFLGTVRYPQVSGWSLNGCGKLLNWPVMLAINLATFCGIYGTKWHYLAWLSSQLCCCPPLCGTLTHHLHRGACGTDNTWNKII